MYQRQNNNSHPAQPHALLKGFPTIVGITRGRAEEQGFAFRNAIGGWKLQHARLFLRCSSCIIVGLKLLSAVNQEIPFPGSFLGSLFNLIATVSQCTDVTVWVIVFCRRISRSCRPYATKIKIKNFLFHCIIVKAACSVAKVANKLENSRFCHRPWNHTSFSSMLKTFKVLEISQGQQERACYCTTWNEKRRVLKAVTPKSVERNNQGVLKI